MIARVSLLLLLVVPLLACARERFSGVDLEVRSSPPLPIEVSSSAIALPVGVAVELGADVRWDEGRETVTESAFLSSANAGTLGVSRSTSAGWVLVGVREGETELLVQSRGATRLTIPVRVTGQ